MTSYQTVSLLGATGLIGGQLFELLQSDPAFSQIRVLSRRPLDIQHPKVQVIVLDFADYPAFRSAIAGSDAVFCAVGTTSKQVKGDRAAYRKVDYDIPVNAARICAETGCPQFLLVSSIGADSRSSSFYLRQKGEVEDTLKTIPVRSVSIFQPSLLLGNRREFRIQEKIGEFIMIPLGFLLPSRLRPIAAREVAMSMIAALKRGLEGYRIIQFREMKDLI